MKTGGISFLLLLITNLTISQVLHNSQDSLSIQKSNNNLKDRNYILLELGFSSDSDEYFEFNTTANISYNYRWKQYFHTAFITGLENYQAQLFAPFSIGIKGDLINKNITPFYDINFGYGFYISAMDYYYKSGKGGPRFNSSIGIKFQNHLLTTLSVGYLSQKAHYVEENINSRIVTDRIFKRMSFRIGFGF